MYRHVVRIYGCLDASAVDLFHLAGKRKGSFLRKADQRAWADVVRHKRRKNQNERNDTKLGIIIATFLVLLLASLAVGIVYVV